MGFSRTASLLAAAGLLLVGACSGSDLVDNLGLPAPPGAGADATVVTPPSDGTTPPATDDGSPPPATDAERPEPKKDASVPGSPEDADVPDASSDDGSQVPDTGIDDAPKMPDTGGGSDASTMDDGSTFACGPTKRCDGTTEYCRIVPSVVVATIILPIDGGKLGTTYTCVALPPCDAADPCTCLQGGILPAGLVVGTSCSCSDHNGDITQSCSGGIQPQGT